MLSLEMLFKVTADITDLSPIPQPSAYGAQCNCSNFYLTSQGLVIGRSGVLVSPDCYHRCSLVKAFLGSFSPLFQNSYIIDIVIYFDDNN
jgi:hypothetical protein